MIDVPKRNPMAALDFHQYSYFNSQISLVQIFQCSYTALTVLVQLNSSQDSTKSGAQQ